jgi:tetratricopeptide (TPR) repeat protein
MAGIAAVIAQALQTHQGGNLRLAEELYQQILQVAPDHADSHHLLGVLAYQMGHYDQAVARIRHALLLNPWAGVYHSNLGAVYEANGQMAEALASFQEFLSLEPHRPEAYNAVGNALLKLGRLQEAVTHLRHALSLRPDFRWCPHNIARIRAT